MDANAHGYGYATVHHLGANFSDETVCLSSMCCLSSPLIFDHHENDQLRKLFSNVVIIYFQTQKNSPRKKKKGIFFMKNMKTAQRRACFPMTLARDPAPSYR